MSRRPPWWTYPYANIVLAIAFVGLAGYRAAQEKWALALLDLIIAYLIAVIWRLHRFIEEEI